MLAFFGTGVLVVREGRLTSLTTSLATSRAGGLGLGMLMAVDRGATMGRRQSAWAGSAVAGTAAVVAAGLGPVTNYASATVPGWAAHAWVIWPVFAVLVIASIGLMLWSRRLDALSCGGGQRS